MAAALPLSAAALAAGGEGALLYSGDGRLPALLPGLPLLHRAQLRVH